MASLENVVSQNLRCSICLNILTEPKLLSCTHNSCESCLADLLLSQCQLNKLTCPSCRQSTFVPDGLVSKLLTNQLLKTIVSDIKDRTNFCGICDKETEAKHYCCDCRKTMCTECCGGHAAHKIVILNGINKIEEKDLCQEHTWKEGKQECTDVCITCEKYICTRCRLFRHERRGHLVKSIADYEAFQRKETQLVGGRTNPVTELMKESKQHVQGETQSLLSSIDSVKSEIVETFDSMEECHTAKQKLCEGFDKIKDDVEKSVSRLSRELLEKLFESPPHRQGNSVVSDIRDSLYDSLKSECQDTSECSKRVKEEYKINVFEKGRYGTWTCEKGTKFHIPNSMECMVATAHCNLAIGCSPGGIEIFSSDGELQERILCDMKIRGLDFLSDGRYVVRDAHNVISLHTTAMCEHLGVRFETLSDEEGGHGGITVDGNDHIYVGYRRAKKIQVFSPDGGKAMREIPCEGYEPMQIYAMKRNRLLLVKGSANSVHVIDEFGVQQHELVKDSGTIIHPAVTGSDLILVARLGRGTNVVSIDQYSTDLKHQETLVDEEVVPVTDRKWFCLREISPGNIAFCTPDRLYTFCRSISLGDRSS